MKTALGKGLEALIPEKGEEVVSLDIDRIFPGEQQPRKTFKDDSLNELAASIKEKGILQPVIVSRVGDGSFRLVKYAHFLLREVFPAHDQLCLEEGRLMLEYLKGREGAKERLAGLSGRTSNYLEQMWG